MLPREKFLSKGIDSLSIPELISILLSSGIKGRGFESISKSVYRKLKAGTNYEEMIGVKGLGPVKAMQLVCAVELGRRLYEKDSKKRVVRDTKEAYEELRYIANYKREHLVAVFLNARYEILSKKVISIGSLDSITVVPRDIVTPALIGNAAYILLGHNHPSGDCSPSKEDLLFTNNLKKACEIVGVKLLDHIVLSGNSWQRVDIG